MRARTTLIAGLLVLAACGGSKQPKVLGDVAFRVLSEKEVTPYCVDGPDFELASNEHDWIDIFDRETECQPEHDIKLPDVDFTKEVGLAAWWRVDKCLGSKIHTDAIKRVGSQIVVSATATEPPQGTVCASARAELESFYVLERSNLFNGTQTLKFVLNGVTVGTERPGGSNPT
jgi:hypothetical protein